MPGCQRERFTGDLHFPYRHLILRAAARARLRSVCMGQETECQIALSVRGFDPQP
jgi:hypothetical protein